MFFKIGLLKNFAIFTGKQLGWRRGLTRNFIKKRLQHRRFPKNVAKFLRTAFLAELLWWLLLIFSAIYSLNFLQSKDRKSKTFWRENTKSLVSCLTIIFSIRTLWDRDGHPRYFKKRGSVKFDVSKLLFPDIGKISNR